MSYTMSDCRVCLQSVGIWPIFGDDRNPDISMEVYEFGSVPLKEDDDFPKHICGECFKQLQGAITFRKHAKRSNIVLKYRKRKMMDGALKSTDLQTQAVKTETQKSSYSYDGGKIEIDFVAVKETINEDSVKNEPSQYYKFGDFETHDDTEQHQNDSDIQNETYNCKYCNLTYNNELEYDEHRNTVEHKRNYVISFLPKKKKNMGETSGKKTANSKEIKCDICDTYFTKLLYPKHMQNVHNIAIQMSEFIIKKECPICKKMYSPSSLFRHLKTIHGEQKNLPKVKLECPICKKLFSKDFYPLHMQRHKQGDTRNYICDQCGKKFFFKSSFCTHRLIHTNELPYKCQYCPYRGRTKDLLKIHVRTHTGDYPFKCTQCDTRCLTKSNLNSHMRRHRGPIDFICDTCSRGFYTKIQLERHITVNHYGIKNHVCSTCGAAFGYRHGLVSHQRKVHKRPKGMGKPKAIYLQLAEEGLLQPEQHTTANQMVHPSHQIAHTTSHQMVHTTSYQRVYTTAQM